MINEHNLAIASGAPSQYGRQQIKRHFFFTGYFMSASTTQMLLSLVRIPNDGSKNDVRYLANNILIAPRPLQRNILEKVGGIGKKIKWEVTGIGVFEDKVWAASVKPVPETERYYTETPTPLVVLALRRGARPIDANKIRNWEPVPPDKAYVFDAIVGEKVLLRVEEENGTGEDWENTPSNRSLKRRHAREADEESSQNAIAVYQQQHHNRYNPLPRKPHGDSYRGESYYRYHGNNAGRGGGGHRGHRGGGSSYRGHRGDRGGSHYRGRGRAGGGTPYGYRSLDDMPMERNLGPGAFGQDGADNYRDNEEGGVRIDYSNGGPAGLPYNG